MRLPPTTMGGVEAKVRGDVAEIPERGGVEGPEENETGRAVNRALRFALNSL